MVIDKEAMREKFPNDGVMPLQHGGSMKMYQAAIMHHEADKWGRTTVCSSCKRDAESMLVQVQEGPQERTPTGLTIYCDVPPNIREHLQGGRKTAGASFQNLK